MTVEAGQSLYSRDVLRLAMALPHDDRLSSPNGTATRRSPLCGSEISVEVRMVGDRIADIAIRGRACALGQASAALLRDKAKGLSGAEIAAARNGIAAMLESNVAPDWAEYEPLAYARDYPARHGAILLPFDTLIAAIEGAQN